MYRARSEGVPDKLLEFFRSKNPNKDAQRFLSELGEWYFDPEKGTWIAPWNSFVFPEEAHFKAATFVDDASFLGAIFMGRAHFERAKFTGNTSFVDAAFTGLASFEGAEFRGNASFRDAKFTEIADFELSEFKKEADFTRATFTGISNFSDAVFTAGPSFIRATFKGTVNFDDVTFGDQSFGTNFNLATFDQDARFIGARFESSAYFPTAIFTSSSSFERALFVDLAAFDGTTFRGATSFENATFKKGTTFSNAVFHRAASFEGVAAERFLVLDAEVGSEGVLRLSRLGRSRDAGSDSLIGAPVILFGRMSLARVQLQDLDASELRFVGSADIDRVSLFGGVRWRREGQGYVVADQVDLKNDVRWRRSGFNRFADALDRAYANDSLDSGEEPPDQTPDTEPLQAIYREWLQMPENSDWRGSTTWEWPEMESQNHALEVERIYRALRKNREDSSDRVGAHSWYWSEMEIGRRYPQNPSTRFVRSFYKWTSEYGLSFIRPAILLLAISLIGLALFMVQALCPVTRGQCVDWNQATTLVLRALSFQPLPGEISFPGALTELIWVGVRFMGAAMLLSIGVALRNQISR